MKNWMTRIVLFSLFSLLQIKFVDAKEYTIPAEFPKNCVESQKTPCAVTTGDEPRMFPWDKSLFELDRNIVMESNKKKIWNIYSGLVVLDSKTQQTIHTPFADIKVGESKIMIHVMKEKLRVLCLDGEGVKIKARGQEDESFLVPGFQNWYGGVNNGEADSGVVTVIDLHEYSKMRVPFFLNYAIGFPKELETVAARVKWAALQASIMHKELYERKVASLEEIHQDKVKKKHQKVEFNNYLRKLFLKKLQYDY